MASLAGEKLAVALEKFQKALNHVKELKEETTSCFQEIMREIPNMAMDNFLLPAERQEVEDVLNLKPCVIFTGQTNCGKSSLINEILQKSVLPANETPCTARLVRLTFSENPYYRIGEDEEVAMKGSIPRQVVQLGVDDRRDANEIAKYVTCGIKNGLLKSGLDIIDSPGRNENEELNQLLKNEVERIPILVYVVDGHNQLTIQDAEDLRTLYNQFVVFYVVSKVDSEDDSDSDSDSESGDEKATPAGVKQERMAVVYSRLVEEGLLDKHTRMNECQLFHGLSAWKLHEARESAMADSKHTVYLADFENFKSCLIGHIEEILEAKVTIACNNLAKAQKRCIDSLLSKAEDPLTIEETLKDIEKIKLLEQDFYRRVEQKLTDKTRMEMSLKTILSQCQEELVEDIGQITFERQHNIQEGAYVTGEEAVKKCGDHVKDILITRLIDKYQKGLKNIFQNEESLMLELQRTQNLKNTREGIKHALVLVCSLTQSLFDSYKIPLDLSKCVRNLTFWGRLKEGLWNFFRAIAHPIDFIRGRTMITVKWKQGIARKFLASIDTMNLASEVAEALKSRFDVAHINFQENIIEHKNNVERSLRLSKEQLSSIQQVAPKMASVELRTIGILDVLKYGTPTFLRQIGEGGQGEVWEVTARDKANYALKLVGDPGSEDLLGKLALEIHYTRSISHEHVMPVLGSFVIEKDGKQHLAVLYELMESDVMHMLRNDPGDLKIRLGIGLQVASALNYMHSAGLMHRDIKPENVLLDSEKKAKLADFGLCKPLAMSNQTICGTPLFLAPEILDKEGSYDPSVDVYSFGILLWFLCDGRGKNPLNVVWLALFGLCGFCRLGERPERRPNFSDECWQLMTTCWDSDPKKRPSFDDIISKLKAIIANL
ncbi:dual serine/threonine and tyrosine protein kinase [Lingula anatina]|uniref:Dual serine/threonine and tyrosine protein kinase n=1 Tax=Lingula anatina TaxID=7574 RepID=A0A1S3JVK3_LINAN|nr:dual serine/threonine and tyrosine protein kinase [Lingula anatina]|eukprot:XP_013414081.1 dual serine/threonine and tyrosine protein kinase [Lingula anatina]